MHLWKGSALWRGRFRGFVFPSALIGILFPSGAHYVRANATSGAVNAALPGEADLNRASGIQYVKGGPRMKPALQIVPLALLFAGAVVGVWRGFNTKPDKTNNRAKGGGAKWKNWK